MANALESTRRLCSTDSKLWMLHRYETDFGIHNHDAPVTSADGMALVRMHPMEDSFTHGPLYDRIVKYDELNIHGRYGLNLNEFLSLPREVVNLLFERAVKPRESEKPVIQTLEDTYIKGKR